jgi:23S rRNA pseudouridine1911/1915/1917 synthase
LNEKTGSWTVPAGTSPWRLDNYLLSLIPGESRSRIQKWIRAGLVTVNGARAKTGYRVREGDRIAWEPPPSSATHPVPENIPLEILYRDDSLAVIVKPAGLVCHAGAGTGRGTLVNALLYHLGPIDTGDPMRPGIVHRLDKQTSGLMVVARDIESHRHLARQFKNREVGKEYLAVVYGEPHPPQGTIDRALGRDPRDRKRFSVRARRRRSALTHYALERTCGPFALLRVRPATGRTHQIRVHLAHLGHPVVGDQLYGAGRQKSLTDPRLRHLVSELGRHLLHACRLEFRHPRTGLTMSFSSPLPAEIARFLEAARAAP